MSKEKKKDDKGIDVDFGIGKIGLGGIFEGIEKLVDLAAKLQESGGEIKKEGEIDLTTLKEGMKGVFGFSIKSAGGGRPVVEPFGNIRKTPKGPKVEEEREPIVDIFNEHGEIRLYAEMPGVNAENIKIDIKDDILVIRARTGQRNYYKEILLPEKVRPDTLASHYKNGILEITVKKI